MDESTSTERAMWALYEPIHEVSYFAAEARTAFADAGLRGFWRGYFAGRAAPLGPVPVPMVVAAFYLFAPAMVSRAIPEIWTVVEPERALTLRLDAATQALAGLLDGADEANIRLAAELLEQAVAALDPAGRVLGTANAVLPAHHLPAYDQPSYRQTLARLWQAATTLREHRGDGHNAALLAAGLDPCEVLVLRCGMDLVRETVQPSRGWTELEWAAAADRLRARDLLDDTGAATVDGREAMAEVEAATDRAAAAPWQALGESTVVRLAELLYPLAKACYSVSPPVNPIGVPPPALVTQVR